MDAIEYWKECISIAADECGLVMSADQLEEIASSVQSGHENYGMAYYSPPASDRYAAIEREWKKKYDDLKKELEQYTENAEKAVAMALNVKHGTPVTVGEHGEVLAHNGRTWRVQ